MGGGSFSANYFFHFLIQTRIFVVPFWTYLFHVWREQKFHRHVMNKLFFNMAPPFPVFLNGPLVMKEKETWNQIIKWITRMRLIRYSILTIIKRKHFVDHWWRCIPGGPKWHWKALGTTLPTAAGPSQSWFGSHSYSPSRATCSLNTTNVMIVTLVVYITWGALLKTSRS